MMKSVTLLVVMMLSGASGGAAYEAGVEKDLAYAPGGADHTLDLQWPSANGYPTVLFVHGGSLSSGDKADAPYDAICRNFVAHGIACASTNYTLINERS